MLILLSSGIAFPFFITFIGCLVWIINHKLRQKVFSKVPFDQVETIGFYKTYLGSNLKWDFTTEIKEGKINGFILTMNISNEQGRTIEYDTATEWKKLDKSEYVRLSEKFKQFNIEFRIGSLVKQYDTKHCSFLTTSDLRQDLEQFTTLISQEGFKAKVR